MHIRRRVVASLLVIAVVSAVSACGGDKPSLDRGKDQAGGEGSELQHIHGLGVDPGTSSLVIATHSGLFEAPPGGTTIRRRGTSRQDVMGFSVLGPGRFIGSGHPDPSQDLPPNLGLIESRDGGRSWTNISLLGEADFHVLRSAGSRVYGFDGTQGRLMTSSDGGRAWKQRTPPAGLFDLAIAPGQPGRVVISTERGVFASEDAGKGWRPRRTDTAGLLAWPAADRLYLVDGQGQVLRSPDGAKSFKPVGTIAGQPAAFTSQGDELLAALSDGSVKRSTDGGATWTLRAAP